MSPPVAAHQRPPIAGVLLVNLGTPTTPTAAAIRRYLRAFLSDRRVVELPRWVWRLVLNLLVLPLRPRRLVPAYESVWTADGSPLMAISRRQAAGVAQRLRAEFGDRVIVKLCMTYGEPGIGAALDALLERGATRVVVLPLYPQYSATTTAAVFDAVWRHLMGRRRVPALRTVDSYHDEPAYIAALAASVHRHWRTHGRARHLLFSFHSIPRQCLDRGDPYHCLCQKTARLAAEALGLETGTWSVSFQSRIGRQPWLKPYTDVVVAQLARAEVGTLDVICPGFSADCLETLEEVAIRYRENFAAAGGEALRYIPALNDDLEHLDLIAGMVRRELAGWVPEGFQTPSAARLAEAQRALESEALRAPPGGRA